MADSYSYGGWLLLIGVVGLLAVLAGRITQRVPLPAPALLLAGTAIAVQLVPSLHRPAAASVDHLVTVALVLILFDGGRQLGWSKFRRSVRPIALTGVLGTFGTTAGVALLGHLLGLSWYPALLVAAAIAPTDPAVVFSVLGQREIVGESGTILEGESGANDPVGIALMASLLSAGKLSGSALGHAAGQFLLQLAVGAVVGLLGGWLLLTFSRRVPLPTPGLYPVRTLAGSFVLFGAAVLAHGSGFLAVFIAGILLGEAGLPYQREVEHVHSAAASLGEIVAFVALGMTVNLAELSHRNVWLPGLVLAVLLTGAGPSAAGRRVPDLVQAGRSRACAGAVGGPEGGGADPARHLPAGREAARHRAAVRDRGAGGGLLGHGAGHRAAGAGRPAAGTDAAGAAGAVGVRRPVAQPAGRRLSAAGGRRLGG